MSGRDDPLTSILRFLRSTAAAPLPALAPRLAVPDDVDELPARDATILVSDQRARIRDRCKRDDLWRTGSVGEQMSLDLEDGKA